MSDLYAGLIVPPSPVFQEDQLVNQQSIMGYLTQLSTFLDDLLYRTKMAGLGFAKRPGTLSAYDKVVGDLTTDGTWRDLSLSTILPKNAKAVLLRVTVKDDAAGSVLSFRENGATDDTYNLAVISTQVVNVENSSDLIVQVVSQTIEYNAANTTWTAINIVVKGWYY